VKKILKKKAIIDKTNKTMVIEIAQVMLFSYPLAMLQSVGESGLQFALGWFPYQQMPSR
jgi:hypothetical protein